MAAEMKEVKFDSSANPFAGMKFLVHNWPEPFVTDTFMGTVHMQPGVIRQFPQSLADNLLNQMGEMGLVEVVPKMVNGMPDFQGAVEGAMKLSAMRYDKYLDRLIDGYRMEQNNRAKMGVPIVDGGPAVKHALKMKGVTMGQVLQTIRSQDEVQADAMGAGAGNLEEVFSRFVTQTLPQIVTQVATETAKAVALEVMSNGRRYQPPAVEESAGVSNASAAGQDRPVSPPAPKEGFVAAVPPATDDDYLTRARELQQRIDSQRSEKKSPKRKK